MGLEDLLEIDYSVKSEMLASFKLEEQELDNYVSTLRKWLDQQPHLPKDISDHKLQVFLLLNKMSIERCKEKLDAHFTLKTMLPKYFSETFASSKKLQDAIESASMIPYPKLYRNRRIYIAKVNNPDPECYNPVAVHAVIFSVLDLCFEHDICESTIVVSDMSNFTFGHAVKADINIAKEAKALVEKAYSGRIAEIHFINLNPVCDVVLKAVKSVLKEKIANRINSHKSFESLYNYIPKEYLPKDFGGTLRPYHELLDLWKRELISQETYFQKLKEMKVIESLRPKELRSDLFEDFQGSFRQLNVD